MKFDNVILDMDILVYRCGFAVQSIDKETNDIILEPVHHAYYNINSMVEKCLRLSECTRMDNVFGYLTIGGKDNFRFDIFKYYKENRVKCKEICGDSHPYDCHEKLGHELIGKRPEYYKELRDYIQKRWHAEMIFGQEADDACSIKHYELNARNFLPEEQKSIIWTIDKDLNNVPGWHGNIATGNIFFVAPLEALQNFYLQILTGDTSDGIPRISKGWRQKETEGKLKTAKNEAEMIDIVQDTIYTILEREYKNNDMLVTDEVIRNEMIWRGQLVWMRTKQNEFWIPPCLNVLTN